MKRTVDVAGALVLLTLAAPVLAVAAAAIRLDSKGPALYRCERVGRNERVFVALKLRSMYVDADDRVHREHLQALLRAQAHTSTDAHGRSGGSNADHDGKSFKLVADDRITRVGRFLRTMSLDEVPQLINVLRGEMSLVGPRPEVPYALGSYEPWHRRRFNVLPGLTGLWQVSGRDALSPAEMLRLDVEYADTWSLRMDLSILLRTPLALIDKMRRRTA